MPRPVTWDHANNSHTQIIMTPERSDAIRRVARQLGVSNHELIQRSIDLMLSAYGESTSA